MKKFVRGFTLVELMLAIMLLAIGATMAAALFATAIKQTQSSLDSVNGTIICENGLAIAETVLHPDTPALATTALAVIADENTVGVISLASQHYAGSNAMGFVLLARTIDDNGDGIGEGQEVVAVSYVKKQAANTVALQTVNGVLSGDVVTEAPCTFTVTGGMANVREGSPIIRPGGRFAMIVSIDQAAGTISLDRYLDPPDPNVAWWPNEDCFVVVESNVPLHSPALSVMARAVRLK